MSDRKWCGNSTGGPEVGWWGPEVGPEAPGRGWKQGGGGHLGRLGSRRVFEATRVGFWGPHPAFGVPTGFWGLHKGHLGSPLALESPLGVPERFLVPKLFS